MSPSSCALARFLSLPRGERQALHSRDVAVCDDFLERSESVLFSIPNERVPVSVSEAYRLSVFGTLLSFTSQRSFRVKCTHPAVIRRLTQQLLTDTAAPSAPLAQAFLVSLLLTLINSTSEDVFGILVDTRGHLRLLDLLLYSLDGNAHVFDLVKEILLSIAIHKPHAFREALEVDHTPLLRLLRQPPLHAFVSVLLLVIVVGGEAKPSDEPYVLHTPRLYRVIEELIRTSPSISARIVAALTYCRLLETPHGPSESTVSTELTGLLTYLRKELRTPNEICSPAAQSELLVSSSVEVSVLLQQAQPKARSLLARRQAWFASLRRLSARLASEVAPTDSQIALRVQRLLESSECKIEPQSSASSSDITLTEALNLPSVSGCARSSVKESTDRCLDGLTLHYALSVAFDTLAKALLQEPVSSATRLLSTTDASTRSATVASSGTEGGSPPREAGSDSSSVKLEFLLWLTAAMTSELRLKPGHFKVPLAETSTHTEPGGGLDPETAFDSLIPPLTIALDASNTYLASGLVDLTEPEVGLRKDRGVVSCLSQSAMQSLSLLFSPHLRACLRKLALYARSGALRELAARVTVFLHTQGIRIPLSDFSTPLLVGSALTEKVLSEKALIETWSAETALAETVGVLQGLARTLAETRPAQITLARLRHETQTFCRLSEGVAVLPSPRTVFMLSLVDGGLKSVSRPTETPFPPQDEALGPLITDAAAAMAADVERLSQCNETLSQLRDRQAHALSLFERATLTLQSRAHEAQIRLQHIETRLGVIANRKGECDAMAQHVQRLQAEIELAHTECHDLARDLAREDNGDETHSRLAVPALEDDIDVFLSPVAADSASTLSASVALSDFLSRREAWSNKAWTAQQLSARLAARKAELGRLEEEVREVRRVLVTRTAEKSGLAADVAAASDAEVEALLGLIKVTAVLERDLGFLRSGNGALEAGLDAEHEARRRLGSSAGRLEWLVGVVENWMHRFSFVSQA